MSCRNDLQLLTLRSIARRCAQETELFFQRRAHDTRYCFELLRRAIVDRSEQAWEMACSQYRPLIAGWVARHPAFPTSGEEVQYFVNGAWAKMWVAVTPDRFARFPDLKALLRYLQMCVHSVILDQVRSAERDIVNPPPEEVQRATHRENPSPSSVEHEALTRMQRQDLWQAVTARLNDEKERRVVYGSFVLGLKPRELHRQFRGTFRDVNEVYRIKENVLARLRRDPDIRQFVGEDA